jgi:hypothetical protein
VRTAPTSWQIAVAPRMSATNVREWLDRLVSAWQRGDVATLSLYGVVTGDADAEAMRQRFRRRRDHSFAIANERIRTSGQYADVAFDRIERDDAGKVVETVPQSFVLEKRADGFVALRYPAGTSLAHTPR